MCSSTSPFLTGLRVTDFATRHMTKALLCNVKCHTIAVWGFVFIVHCTWPKTIMHCSIGEAYTGVLYVHEHKKCICVLVCHVV